jgi:hypothetical protein
MSITGVASSILSALSGSQNNQSGFGQINSEFQQLGQDLQAGNLSQAQQDFATLSQSLTGGSQSSSVANSTGGPLTQIINQLGQDLQAGNLAAAQQDFTTLQQDIQQSTDQAGGYGHHHRRAESSQSSSSQQSNPIAQEFSLLAQSPQAGNLQGAQQAFSTLQNDLQQIGGFASRSNNGAPPTVSGSLNVTA